MPNSAATGRTVFRELMRAARPPTAVLAMADSLAEGVLQEARELGLDVPGELSVVGFDDGPQAPFTVPPLTTVHQPTERKGELAASLLLKAIAAGGLPEPERTMLPAELVVRASSGPPPG
jgi:LacI family transcriptional regulator